MKLLRPETTIKIFNYISNKKQFRSNYKVVKRFMLKLFNWSKAWKILNYVILLFHISNVFNLKMFVNVKDFICDLKFSFWRLKLKSFTQIWGTQEWLFCDFCNFFLIIIWKLNLLLFKIRHTKIISKTQK